MELHPVRRADWEEDSGGVRVHVPRRVPLNFVARIIGKAPYVRLNLDAFGSFVWRRCDGRRTVFEIAREMEREFGEAAEAAVPRLSAYLKRLARERLITYEELT